MICFDLAIDQIAQSGLSSLKVIYYSAQLFNTLTYILSEVAEISCAVKMIPNKLEGRGCQCQRLVKVVDIDEQIYARLRNNSRDKLVGVRKTPRIPAVPLTELNREQKWQMMLSKSMRR